MNSERNDKSQPDKYFSTVWSFGAFSCCCLHGFSKASFWVIHLMCREFNEIGREMMKHWATFSSSPCHCPGQGIWLIIKKGNREGCSSGKHWQYYKQLQASKQASGQRDRRSSYQRIAVFTEVDQKVTRGLIAFSSEPAFAAPRTDSRLHWKKACGDICQEC